MLTIDKTSRKPIYEQIIEGVERRISAGILHEGDKLPSVRELSVLLDANPNTVQKAFTELDRAGLTISHPGRGCFVASGAQDAIRRRGESRLQQMRETALSLLEAGWTLDELQGALEQAAQQYQNQRKDDIEL